MTRTHSAHGALPLGHCVIPRGGLDAVYIRYFVPYLICPDGYTQIGCVDRRLRRNLLGGLHSLTEAVCHLH